MLYIPRYRFLVITKLPGDKLSLSFASADFLALGNLRANQNAGFAEWNASASMDRTAKSCEGPIWRGWIKNIYSLLWTQMKNRRNGYRYMADAHLENCADYVIRPGKGRAALICYCSNIPGPSPSNSLSLLSSLSTLALSSLTTESAPSVTLRISSRCLPSISSIRLTRSPNIPLISSIC
ncbi:hypothetical protein I7I48_02603 [Histoplasma ohiense]|nr:hypothetical protein I7I48_02603 [Histoplasma ohiense (nom. inval.)]